MATTLKKEEIAGLVLATLGVHRRYVYLEEEEDITPATVVGCGVMGYPNLIGGEILKTLKWRVPRVDLRKVVIDPELTAAGLIALYEEAWEAQKTIDELHTK